ncbi:hypothetical protein VUR80DRAFT_7647 [Thermomyces stellatus]
MNDDASRLIAGLEEKLADLDQKVSAYRQDLADEFTRHSQRVLRDLPEPVSATIQRKVALSMHKYPAISPALAPILARADSPKPAFGTAPAMDAAAASIDAAGAGTGLGATASTSTAATTASRPADHEVSHAASGLPRPATPPRRASPPAVTGDLGQMSDSPDDREADLRGVFTPTFLPLLDTSIDRMRSPPTPPKPWSKKHMATTTPMDASEPPRMGSDGPRLSSSPLPTQLPVRPATVRRATDDLSNSSVLSDKSDSKSRRSALRRSSSLSKPQSPRRVRFEVAGTEVLPTSSPSSSSPDVTQPPSDAGYTAPTLEEEDDSARPDSVTSILGLMDAEDDEPPPKKVSSTQALRALSKLPLDSDTVWMPVTQDSNTDHDSEGQVADAVEPNSSLKSEISRCTNRRPPTPPPRRPAPFEIGQKTRLGNPLQQAVESWQDDGDSDDSSDGDFLSIAKPKSFANKKVSKPTRLKSPSPEGSRPVTSRRATTDAVPKLSKGSEAPPLATSFSKGDASQGKATPPGATTSLPAMSAEEEDQDVAPDYSEVFDFEASEGMSARPPTPPGDRSDSDTEDTPPLPRQPLHMHSTSPAVNIPQAPPSHKPASSDDAVPSTPVNVPTSVSKSTPTVGSYKGRPVTMPVVVDPSVHEQAQALGDFSTFVGGLDGRTGMDDGDMSSFRASLANISIGTGKSFMERMMMEEREMEKKLN